MIAFGVVSGPIQSFQVCNILIYDILSLIIIDRYIGYKCHDFPLEENQDGQCNVESFMFREMSDSWPSTGLRRRLSSSCKGCKTDNSFLHACFFRSVWPPAVTQSLVSWKPIIWIFFFRDVLPSAVGKECCQFPTVP